MKYSIYKVTNLVNGKIYIGQTSQSLQQRMREHKCKPNSSLHLDIQKYGIDNFMVEVIESAETKIEANLLEEKWILDTKSYLNEIGYNKAISNKKYASVNGFYNKHHSEESNKLNRLSQPTRKCVVDLKTGMIYQSIRECAKTLNLTKTYISSVCRGGIKNPTKGEFIFIER